MHIGIKEINVNGKRLDFSLNIPQQIRKYFLTNHLFFEYSEDISNVPESILIIPAVANLLTVCLALNVKIHVDEIDEVFLNSTRELEKVFTKGFWNIQSEGNVVICKKTIKNRFNNEHTALLYSGGLDSISSYIGNKDKKPILYSYWGIDVPLHKEKFWDMTRSSISDFADQEGLISRIVKTNTGYGILDRHALQKRFNIAKWFTSVNYGLVLLGSLAPSVSLDVKSIIIASSFTTTFCFGSDPIIDEKIKIGDINVVHDQFDVSRQEKIQNYLAKHPELFKFLRVCYMNYKQLNCGRCEKCERTIIGLIMADCDPNKCNFEFKITDFPRIMRKVKRFSKKSLESYMWKDLQKNISFSNKRFKYYSPEFFEELSNLDFDRLKGNKLLSRAGDLKILLSMIDFNTIKERYVNRYKTYKWRLFQ